MPLDDTLAALADPTRRAILLRLGQSPATLGELAAGFDLTLTGLAKHVKVLEASGLVTTEKVGRVRVCRLGSARLDDVSGWVATYREMLERRLDGLGDFLER